MNLSEDSWLVSTSQQKSVHAVSQWLSHAQAALGRMAGLWATQRRRAQDAAVLQAFSDQDLWDLGLSRSDVPGVINGTYRRD